MQLLETNRLILSEMTLADAPFILALLNDPAWIKNIGDRGVRTIPDAENYLRDVYMPLYARLGFGLWLVRRKTDHTTMGMCGLMKRDSLPHADIGFAFLPEFYGKGYAYEAASACVNYARQTLHLPRLLAITLPENERSITLLQKLGFRFEQTTKMSDDADELNVYKLELSGSPETA